MYSETLKFSKLKNFDDIDFNFTFESLKKTDCENLRSEVMSNSKLQKDKTLFIFIHYLKESFSRLKFEKEIASLCHQQEIASHMLSRLRKTLQSATDEKLIEESRRELRKSVISLYEKNLCLIIEATDVEIPNDKDECAISFRFDHLTEKDIFDTGSFTLITDGKKYKILNCEPPVEEEEELLLKLNQTNDLHSFVVNIRKCFVKILDS